MNEMVDYVNDNKLGSPESRYGVSHTTHTTTRHLPRPRAYSIVEYKIDDGWGETHNTMLSYKLHNGADARGGYSYCQWIFKARSPELDSLIANDALAYGVVTVVYPLSTNSVGTG